MLMNYLLRLRHQSGRYHNLRFLTKIVLMSRFTRYRLLKPFLIERIPAIRHLRCFTTFVVFPPMALYRIRCSSRFGFIDQPTPFTGLTVTFSSDYTIRRSRHLLIAYPSCYSVVFTHPQREWRESNPHLMINSHLLDLRATLPKLF